MKSFLSCLLPGLLAVTAKAIEPDDQLPPTPQGKSFKLSDEIGEWAGDITKVKLPDRFLVDYVRVYDLVDAE